MRVDKNHEAKSGVCQVRQNGAVWVGEGRDKMAHLTLTLWPRDSPPLRIWEGFDFGRGQETVCELEERKKRPE